MKIWKKTTSTNDENKKLETFLLENGFTQKEISRLKFKNPGMTIDGLQARSTVLLCPGQTVQLFLEDQNFHADYLQNEVSISTKLEILYEDEDILVVHKPSGLSCHPGKGHYNENLGSMVSTYCLQNGLTCPIREIGRLDKDTSGAMLFAKHRDAAARLWTQKENGTFFKIYTVLVHGVIPEPSGTIAFDMEEIPDIKNRMRICDNGHGLRAVTNYKLIKTVEINQKAFSLLECSLETGRTHQIRVHMAAMGHPVAGDTFYGINDDAKRLYLHAGEITFQQPYTQEIIHIKIPIE